MSEGASDLCLHVVQKMLVDPLPGHDMGMLAAALTGVPFSDNHGDPMALLPLAARGDADAQREIALQALYGALGALDGDPLILLSEGLMFARMAACQSGDGEDIMTVIAMLSLASTLTPGPAGCDFAAEAIARLESLADHDGEVGEQASRLLVLCAEREPAQTLELAKSYRARMVAATGEK